MQVKPDFDFTEYVTFQITKPHSYCYLLEYHQENQTTIVGCLFIYFYDENPPSYLDEQYRPQHELENPFIPRRVGSILGMYLDPEHRDPKAIQILAKAGVDKAEEMKVTDIDLLVCAEQTGMHALLKKWGFKQQAFQFTKNYTIDPKEELPDLHQPLPELKPLESPLTKLGKGGTDGCGMS
ncbi:MAG: hypothetical protein SWX82_18150 [Cyanobacteriota bacterium]|nr:hypothetical protein [Cyanobacteriota bacterium]